MTIQHQVVLFKENIPAQIFLQKPSGKNALALPHWHHSIEFNYVKEGNMKIMIDSKTSVVSAGHFVFVNSSLIHATDSLDRNVNLEVVTVLISYEWVKKYVSDIDQYFFNFIDNDPEIIQIMLDIDRYYDQKELYYNIKVTALIHELLYALLKKSQMLKKTGAYLQAQRNIEYAKEAIEYIETHFQEPLTLNEVAVKVGLSSEYFSRYFKKVTGDTFLHFLNLTRVIYAKQKIEEGASITQAVIDAGLPNEKTFRRVFKDSYGVNPKEYFKQMSKIDR